MTFRHRMLSILIVSLFLYIQHAHSEEAESTSKSWQEAARESGLSVEDISSLEENRILITNDGYKQIFSAYLYGKQPLFITSDSLLNAYHVLYEESILRIENTMASRLPRILQLILKNIDDTDDDLKGNPVLVSAAKRRAILVTGIALRLIDESFRLNDDELNKLVTQEAGRIENAEGVIMPDWLGKPDETFTALDYSRYKPRGFYTRSDRLKRYFRAVSWLQSIPFRVRKDDELLSILMLGNCVAYGKFVEFVKRGEAESFFRVYRSFIGAGDDWDLITAASDSKKQLRMDLSGDDLQKKRTWLLKQAERYGRGPLINDQIRFAPDDPHKIAEPNYRIISAYRIPDAILFQRTTDLRKFKRPYPDGLEVLISLGSSFAQKALTDNQKADILKTIDSSKAYFIGNSLYLKYLDVLRSLLDEPEPDAPDFMKNSAWEIKSCNTALSGWAQLRHTWVLQAKQTVHYMGLSMVPDGFVEPEPDFFSRMANLAVYTRSILKQTGAFDPDYDSVVQSLERIRDILENVKNEDDFRKKVSQMNREEMMSFELSYSLMQMNKVEVKPDSDTYYREQRQWLDTLASDIRKGQMDKHPQLMEMLRENDYDLDDLWERLERTSRRLEAISHKQLRHVDLNDSEINFIKAYGNTIAGIMLYGGNSYLTPRDDAPRVVDVYANPSNGGYLHAGIGRARRIYVLYPWLGKDILCVGAVMPYYEFVNESRLTDDSWKGMLDSENRPSMPKWVAPLAAGGNLSQPKLAEDH